MESRRAVAELPHPGLVHSLAWHPDGSALASGCSDGGARLWDARTRQLLQVHGCDAGVGACRSVAFHPRGAALLSASADAALRMWDLRGARLAYTLRGHGEGGVHAAAFAPTGDFFASGGADAQLLVWRTNAAHLVGSGAPPPEVVEGLTEAEEAPLRALLRPASATPMPPWRPRGKWTAPPHPASALPRPHAPTPPSPTPSPTPDERDSPFRTANVTAAHAQHRAMAAQGASASSASVGDTLERLVAQMEVVTGTLAMMEARLSIAEEQAARGQRGY